MRIRRHIGSIPMRPGRCAAAVSGSASTRTRCFVAFVVLFLGSMVGHALGGVAAYNSEQVAHGGSAMSVFEFVRTGEFWFQSFQNWQSEFLAVFSIVVLTIFLRQRGSPESKPVHAPHEATGS